MCKYKVITIFHSFVLNRMYGISGSVILKQNIDEYMRLRIGLDVYSQEKELVKISYLKSSCKVFATCCSRLLYTEIEASERRMTLFIYLNKLLSYCVALSRRSFRPRLETNIAKRDKLLKDIFSSSCKLYGISSSDSPLLLLLLFPL